MKKFIAATLTLSALLFLVPLSHAQEKKARVSPHETIKATIDGNDLTIVYGRPYTKDPKTGEKRKIWGGVVPFGKVWRLGADEATLLTIQQPIELGAKMVPAGTYSLYMLPQSDKQASLIVNKQTGQWGTKYDEKQDLARVEMKSDPSTAAADQLTIAIDKNSAGGGTLKVMWDNMEYSVDFKVGG
ncbi:MAG TPA: DUF2911 domain-containing protein [Chthoniobacterales bacterium]|jgi:hypothetical protein